MMVPSQALSSSTPTVTEFKEPVKKDWQVDRKTGEVSDFITFARTEGRFAKQFDADGNPSEALLSARDERLGYWRILQGLAGIEVEREAAT